ncbi:HD domain-containing protein [Pontibacter vulgaris]|uniref:HD domain-containing protein n=1 Tax=Pontibacter vulgaris TaxID=2905679 RepID=UPI001FA7FBDC|nr:HD domain-containing protein [Pontibacter vulgaris]
MHSDEELINLTAEYVKNLLSGEGSGHDWWHIQRVWNNAKSIAAHEQADIFIVELAALLHDIGDHKFHNGDETVGPRMAREWLEKHEVKNETIDLVCAIISELSFKGAGTTSAMSSLEGCIVQDADRLDAIGAIGIARTFAYGGHKGREMYNPNIPPVLHDSFEAYKNSAGPTLNHFYEKLLLLQDRMHTTTAKRIAAERHQYMEEFVNRFLAEWDGRL